MDSVIRKFPIGIQNFESLINDGYVYVDKTALVYRMATTGRYYFLSRPRRFGKSLLLSTIEAYLSGKKELFKGLAIEKLEQKWEEHPILHLDLNTENYKEPDSLRRRLDSTLSYWEQLYGTRAVETSLPLRFEGIVRRACEKTGHRVVILVDEYDKPMLQAIGNETLQIACEKTGHRVVILVDEYDKPMLQAIGNETLQAEYRNLLKAFYSVLKSQDRYIKLAFLTGVTKFGKVSVFSDLNNLNDISMDYRYMDICGITDKELHENFDGDVALLGERNGLTKEECYVKLKEQYDGYHFDYDTVGLYNPFSIFNTLSKLKFSDYWFETGTPSFLVYLLKHSNYRLDRITEEQVSGDLLNSIDSMSCNPIPVIYQSGYLTIKGYDKEFGIYRLGFPNKEVENGFIKYLLPFYTPVTEQESSFIITSFVMDIRQGNVDSFMQRLQSMFADTDYKIVGKMELYFQNAMYLVVKMMGFYTDVERTTSNGRIDVVLQAKDYIYVMELKLDGSADEALRQIEEKGYALPFAKDSRKLYKIGVNFSSEIRGIVEWKIVEDNS